MATQAWFMPMEWKHVLDFNLKALSDGGGRFSPNFVDLEQLVQSNQIPIRSGGERNFIDQLSSRAEHNLKD